MTFSRTLFSLLLVAVLTFSAKACFAEKDGSQSYLAVQNELEQNAKSALKHYRDDVLDLEKKSEDLFKSENLHNSLNEFYALKEEKMKVQNLAKVSKAQPQNDKGYELIAFVSTSIPEKALIRLGQDIHKEGGSVNLRGLINNSFKQTASFLMPYIEEVGEGMNVDPEAFREFDIRHVPCFVVYKDQNNYDKLCGHVTAKYALELSKSKGVLRGS